MSLLLYAVSVLIWGTTFFAITFQQAAPATQSVFYRYFIAAAIFWLISLLRKAVVKHNRAEHMLFAGLGLFLFSLNYVVVYMATAYVVSGLVSVLFSMMIIINAFQLWVICNEKPEPRLLVGAVLGITGLGILFYDDIAGSNVDGDFMFGVGLAMLASLSAATGNVLARFLHDRQVTVLSSNTWGMTYGALFLFVAVMFGSDPWQLPMTTEYIGSLLYLAVFGSVVAFFAYLTLIGRIGAPRAAYTSILYSMLALVISTLFEGMQWTPVMLFGVALILFGNVLILKKE
jgi:drug/metabolite transporter (DMT)-like permease